MILCGLGLLSCTTPIPLAPGCHNWRADTSSNDPPPHCFFFPAGLALDPMGDILYVASSNADLSFGGGTLAAVDLQRFEQAVGTYRDRGDHDPICKNSGLLQLGVLANYEDINDYELAQQVKLGVDPRSFDHCYCSRDPLDDNIVNCESFRFVLSGHTIKTGNFTGQIKLLADDPGDLTGVTSLNRGIYLPVRGDPSLTMIEARRPIGPATGLTMTCDLNQIDLPAGAALSNCDPAHRIQHQLGVVGEVLQEVPVEPFTLAPAEGCLDPSYKLTVQAKKPQCVNAMQQTQDPFRYLMMTHLAGGEVSLFDLGQPLGNKPDSAAVPILDYIQPSTFPQNASAQRGAYGLAQRDPGDFESPWLVSSRVAGQIATFTVAVPDCIPRMCTQDSDCIGGDGMTCMAGQCIRACAMDTDCGGNGSTCAGQQCTCPVMKAVPVVNRGQTFDLTGVLPNTQDLRDLRFEPGGDRAFLAINLPPELAVLDTSLDPRTGTPLTQVLSTIPICPEPSRIAMVRQPGQRGIKTRLYIACYQSGVVAVVDPDNAVLEESIQVGRGPLAMVANFGGPADGGAISPCADPLIPTGQAQGVTCPKGQELHVLVDGKPIGPRGYVATYLDNAIVVVDLDPNSLTYRRVVARIGLPSPKQVM